MPPLAARPMKRSPASPLGDLWRLHPKQLRRRAKFGLNPHPLQVQSPNCGRRSPTPATEFPLARAVPFVLAERPTDPPPLGPSRRSIALPLLPSLPPAPLLRSTLSRSSRRPWWSVSSTLPPLPPASRRCGMSARPPPPWCAATRRLAASRARRALSACRRRRALRCQDCSPRAVSADGAEWREPRAPLRRARRGGAATAAPRQADEALATERARRNGARCRGGGAAAGVRGTGRGVGAHRRRAAASLHGPGHETSAQRRRAARRQRRRSRSPQHRPRRGAQRRRAAAAAATRCAPSWRPGTRLPQKTR